MRLGKIEKTILVLASDPELAHGTWNGEHTDIIEVLKLKEHIKALESVISRSLSTLKEKGLIEQTTWGGFPESGYIKDFRLTAQGREKAKELRLRRELAEVIKKRKEEPKEQEQIGIGDLLEISHFEKKVSSLSDELNLAKQELAGYKSSDERQISRTAEEQAKNEELNRILGRKDGQIEIAQEKLTKLYEERLQNNRSPWAKSLREDIEKVLGVLETNVEEMSTETVSNT